MSMDYARPFYDGKQWRKTREAYMHSQNYICESCGGAACLVHHIEHIKPWNIHDSSITLDFNNLMALCEKCHSEKHIDGQARLHGIAFDEHGNAVKGSNVFLVCGSPGSGKSTYISENKSERDLVVDLDYICAALNGNKVNIHFDNVSILSVALEVRNLLYNIIRKRSGKWNRAYVSNTNTNLGEIRAIANDLGADIVLIDTPLMECIHRIRNDPSRKNMTKVYERLAVEWHKNFNKSVKDAIAPHIG